MLHASIFAHNLSAFHFQRLSRRHLRMEIVGSENRTSIGKADKYPHENQPIFGVQVPIFRHLLPPFGPIQQTDNLCAKIQ
jgi:hypothetical protein